MSKKEKATQCEKTVYGKFSNDQKQSDQAIAEFKKCIYGMGDSDLAGVQQRLANKMKVEGAKQGTQRNQKILAYLDRMQEALSDQVNAYEKLDFSQESSSGSSSSGSDSESRSDSGSDSGSESVSDSDSDSGSGSDSDQDMSDEDRN